MEIFRLFGKILIDNSKAIQELDETEKKAEDAAKSLEELSAQAGEMALTIGAAAAAFVAGIGVKAVMAADDLKKSMNLLQAQTGATDAEMKQFKDSALELYKQNVGQSFEDIARAMSEVARTTGLSGKELQATTKNAIALRDMFDLGVNESARAANSLIKNFGISADQAYTLIAQGAQQGANKNGDLLDTLNEYSVQFKSLGFSAEQFTGVLIDGAKNGSFSIDKVGDAVKEFNIRAKDGSKASMNAFKQLGMNADAMTNAFAGGGEKAQVAFQQVTDAISKIEDPVKKNAVGVALFGTQFEDLEAKAIEALGNIQANVSQNADTLGKINDVKYDSFGEALSGLGRQINADFFIPLGEKLIPKLQELMDLLKENEDEIKAGLNVAVEVLTGLFNGLLEVVEFIIDNFNWLKYAIIAVTAAATAQFVIGTLIPMYNAWRATTVGMTLAQAALNAVMALNPFSWIAIAIGVAVAAIVFLIMNWDTVVKYLKKAWVWIRDIFKKALDWVVSFTKKKFDGMKETITGVWEKIKTSAKTVWEWIMNFFQTTFGKIVAVLGGPITMGLMLIANWDKIKESGKIIWEAIIGYFSGAIERIKSVFGNLRDKGKEIFETLWTNIKGVFEKIGGFFTGFKETFKTLFDGVWEFLKTPLNLIITGLNFFIKGFEKMLNNVINAINSIPDIQAPDWLGGGEFGIPNLKNVKFKDIPALAEGGTITKAGTVMVGEQGPEFLNLPRGAEVVPLDKQQQTVVVNIHNPKIFNERDAEKLGDLLVRSLKLKGIQPRGV